MMYEIDPQHPFDLGDKGAMGIVISFAVLSTLVLAFCLVVFPQ